MSIVRTYCEECGDIRIGPESIVLESDGADGPAVCVITCPLCHAVFRKPANDALFTMLTAIGVPVVEGEHAPLTHADLVRFREMLDADDFVARLAEH